MRETYRSERHFALERNYPSCSGGSCAQGRAPCATPQACQEPDEWTPVSDAVAVLLLTPGVLAFIAIAWAVFA